MRFSTTLLSALLAALTVAQNPFTFSTEIGTVEAGKGFNITWAPSTGTTDTVTLVLRQNQGDAKSLATVVTIACLFPFLNL